MPSVVTNPTAGDLHVSRTLTNFGQAYLLKTDQFVAMQAMPNLPVAKQFDQFFVFNRADFLRDEAAERADGTESKGGGFRLSQTPYQARVWAFHKDVTDRQRAQADPEINLERLAGNYVAQKMLIRRERLFLSTFLVTGVWGTTLVGVNAAPGAGQFLRWNVAASDPVADIQGGMELIEGRTGFRPNRLLLSRTVWNQLIQNDSIMARISGGANTAQPAMVMRSLLAALFEVDFIHVSGGVFNSAVEGATENTAYMAGKHALLYYAPSSVGPEEPTAGVTFSWTGYLGATPNGYRVKRFRMPESLATDRVEGEMAFSDQIIGSELGVFFQDAIA